MFARKRIRELENEKAILERHCSYWFCRNEELKTEEVILKKDVGIGLKWILELKDKIKELETELANTKTSTLVVKKQIWDMFSRVDMLLTRVKHKHKKIKRKGIISRLDFIIKTYLEEIRETDNE